MSNVKELYPSRYYASYDTASSGTTPVTGWYDMWFYSSIEGMPAADTMVPLSQEQWDAHMNNPNEGKGVSKGELVDYTPPPATVPLNLQAQYALAQARTYVQNNFILLGETPTQPWIDYQKELIAIENGTDTTSTTLPTHPNA